MPKTSIILNAPAKLNLHLSITGKRPDGYHLLKSLIVKITLSDVVNISKQDSQVVLNSQEPSLPKGRDNIIIKTAEMFFAETGIFGGAAFQIEKHIPMAAGLGGGSSDAAAALQGLNELYDFPLDQNRLLELGKKLGADVPFFLFPQRAAWVEGIGEKPILFPKIEDNLLFLLINPNWPLSTTWVYKNFKLELTTTPKTNIYSGLNEGSFKINSILHNDLESVVIPHYPEIGLIKNLLLESRAEGALMSGSGPTVFGIFSSQADLVRAKTEIENSAHRKWAFFIARIIKEVNR